MKKTKCFLCFLLSFVLFMSCAPTAHAQTSEEEAPQDKTLAPYFMVEGGDAATDSFPLKETSVSVNISGIIADTYVTQVYSNNGETPINASYVFPASTRVSVHGMTMQIGNQLVTAQIKEKEEAEEEFEEAKEEGKSASLMEERRPNVFTMDVANIMPGDQVSIELHYTEMITSSEGIYQFVFPTVTGPRYASASTEVNDEDSQWVETPYLPSDAAIPGTYDINVTLSAAVPITGLSCKSHEIGINWGSDNTSAQISLAQNGQDAASFAGNRDFILEYKLTGSDTTSGLMLSKGGDGNDNFFLLSLQPPERVEAKDIPPREYIFVLDVSGSMCGYPIDTAKTVIRDLVSQLREEDCFNLILFSDEAIPLSSQSLPATTENVKKAMALIDKQEGSGGTELASAIKGAIALSSQEDISHNVVVITDGYVSGEREIFEMINENLGTISFFPFGIGSSVNRYLIEGIAKAGQGEAFVVTDSQDAQSMAELFRTYIQSPVLTNIKVSFDGFDVYDVEPQFLSTLFSQKPIVLMGKWRGEVGGAVHITGETADGEYAQDIPIEEITPVENPSLSYLWARKRLERLTDYGLNNNNPDVKQQVTNLGLTYHMLTPYTSFIAVVDTVRNEEGNATDVDQPLPLPLEVSELAVSYAMGSEPGELWLLLLLVPVFLLRKVHRRKTHLSSTPDC